MLIVENMFTFAILRNAPKQTTEQTCVRSFSLVFFVEKFPIELLMRLVFGISAPRSRHANGRAYTHTHTHSPYPRRTKQMRRNIAFVSNDSWNNKEKRNQRQELWKIEFALVESQTFSWRNVEIMLKLILCEMVLCCYHNSVWTAAYDYLFICLTFQGRDVPTRKTNNNHIHLFYFAIKCEKSWFVLSATATAREM